MNQSLPAFDVGDHFSEMSNSLSKQFGSFALIALVVAAIHVALTYTFGETSPLTIIINIVVYAITGPTAIMVAYDGQLGRKARLGQYVGLAVRMIIPLVLLAMLQWILISVGLIFLICPGLYIGAMLYVMIPAVVTEKAGFGAFSRSMSLSEGYRISIVLVVFLLLLICIVIGAIASAISYAIISVPFIGVAIPSFMNAFIVLIPAVSGALVYWRLVERKEGKSLEQIADVFA